ncbi:T9SS type A sorting domain-containing protein [bacterium SCSIO 12741]|nr:T9SS type A sorting domain-containing protein [bacterium SCSIO 12741]
MIKSRDIFLVVLFLLAINQSVFGQWREINQTGRANFGLEMFSADIGYLSTNSGLLKTEDGWQSFQLCSNPYDVWAYDFIDDLSGVIIYTDVDKVQTGYGSTSNNCIWNYKAKSAGGGYTTVFISDSGTVYFNIESNQFVAGSNWLSKLDTFQLDSTNAILDILFYSDKEGIVTTVLTHGHDRGILRTNDGGNSWSKVFQINNGLIMIKKVEDVTYICGDNGLILKSSDQGRTWSNMPTPFQDHLIGIQFTSKDTGFVYGGSFEVGNENGKIYSTYDAGSTWSDITPADVVQPITGAYFLSGNEGYVAEKTGKIYYTETGGGDFLGTKPYEGQEESIAIQIYPNPAKDELNIVLPIENFASNQQVIVRDLAGKVLEIKSFDSPKGTIETTALAPGVYFIQIGSEYLKFQVL